MALPAWDESQIKSLPVGVEMKDSRRLPDDINLTAYKSLLLTWLLLQQTWHSWSVFWQHSHSVVSYSAHIDPVQLPCRQVFDPPLHVTLLGLDSASGQRPFTPVWYIKENHITPERSKKKPTPRMKLLGVWLLSLDRMLVLRRWVCSVPVRLLNSSLPVPSGLHRK